MQGRMAALTALALTLAVGGQAHAQSAQSSTAARVSGSFGGSFGTGGATVATGGSAGFQFTRYAGLEFDVSVVPNLDLNRPPVPMPATMSVLTRVGYTGSALPTPFPGFTFTERARALSFLANYVTEFPVGVRWLKPYVLGGGGVASVSRRVDITVPTFEVPPLVFSPDGSPIVLLPTIGLESRTLRTTDTDLALAAGGGLEFLVSRHLGVGADFRYSHLFGPADFNLTRVGTRLSLRF
jgi:opacity protein-like surface antigen